MLTILLLSLLSWPIASSTLVITGVKLLPDGTHGAPVYSCQGIPAAL